jgi:hypothetical protein
MPSNRGFIFGGIDSLVEPGPWHYGVDYLSVFFRANPASLQRLLPRFFKVRSDGVGVAYVSEFVSISEGKPEATFEDPERTIYKEAALGVGCSWRGKAGVYFPIMWVDKDWSLARGWLNGYAKRLADRIVMTKLHPMNPGIKPLGKGARLAGYCVKDGSKVLTVRVRIRGRGRSEDLVKFGATFGVRRLPTTHKSQLQREEPVEVIRYDASAGDIWSGEGELEAPGLDDNPTVLKGLFYKSGFSISGARVLASS